MAEEWGVRATSVGSVVNGRRGGLEPIRPPAAAPARVPATDEELLTNARSVCVSDLEMAGATGRVIVGVGLAVVMVSAVLIAQNATGNGPWRTWLSHGCGVDSFELLAEVLCDVELAANARMAKSGEERAVFLFT